MNMLQNYKKGSILIFSLWILSLLTVFAVHIGLTIQRRATLISKVENRSSLHNLALSAVRQAISALVADLQRNNYIYTPQSKYYRHNNPALFQGRRLGKGSFDVFYQYSENFFGGGELFYGVVDEEGKLNINRATQDQLTALFLTVLTTDGDYAGELATALIDWREAGESQLKGFYSDDYYTNLQYPYQPKNSLFEHKDEIRLVKGFTDDVIKRISPYITIYGDGMVNINTASAPVMASLGLEDVVVEKMLLVRRGKDNLENTEDDYVFQKTHDIASEMLSFIKLEIAEVKQIDALNQKRLIKTNSLFYGINARAKLDYNAQELNVSCVYNVWANKIEYWREK